jgi:hypothetical protein
MKNKRTASGSFQNMPKLIESINLGQITPFPTQSFDRNTKEGIVTICR